MFQSEYRGSATRAGVEPSSVLACRAPGRDGLCSGKVEPIAGAARPTRQSAPEAIVIVGGGAAGQAAAEMLRHEGYSGPITMLSDDDAPPCDRPNLSKDYLAGNAPEEWIPLRPAEFYGQHKINLWLGTRVVAIHTNAREVELADGSRHGYGALLLATGAEPVRLGIPGSDLPHIHYLRTLADSRALIGRRQRRGGPS